MSLTDLEIAGALQHNGYDEVTALHRVPLIQKFFKAAQLDAQLTAHPSLRPRRQIEFFTGDTKWNVDNADVIAERIALPARTEWMGGTWLDTAPLTYLARVCDIASRLLGNDWTAKFQKRLLNRGELLDLLNEIWWLGCWKGLQRVTPSPRAEVSGDNDWSLEMENGLNLKLQVKRRRSDLIRLSHPTIPPYGLFDKLSKRFSASSKAQFNVGVITIYAGITDSVLRALDDYFVSDTSKNVDAIALWSPGVAEGVPSCFLRDRKSGGIIRGLFDLDPVDLIYDTANVHPISRSEAAGDE